MKRIVFALAFLICTFSVFAMQNTEVTPEYLVEILSDAGYEASVDQYGDVEFLDQYDMYYWIACIPDENRLYIQSSWSATESITSAIAYEKINNSNSRFYFIRTYYDPVYRSFYCDYDFLYPNIFDNDLFLKMIEEFLFYADIYTDYLIGEGAI